MNNRSLAFIAVSCATIIYGVNYTIAKDVMPTYVKPFGFIVLRVVGAAAFFWFMGLFFKKDKVASADLLKIFLAAFFGVGLNMLTFFKGLSLTHPISASVMMVTSPIMVLLFSSWLLKEKLYQRKIFGVFIGLSGALSLILYGSEVSSNATNPILGNILVFINASSYGLYLVLIKKIVAKYSPITFMKWLYLLGLIFVVPFGLSEVQEIEWQKMPSDIYSKIGFVVFFTTCITYLFNLYGLSKLKPTTVSVFIYLQPVIASIYALFTGKDELDLVKIVSTIIIFVGVYLVTSQRKKVLE